MFLYYLCDALRLFQLIADITIFWQIHDLLVSVIKLGVKGFNIPGKSFPTYKNGKEGFLRTKGMELVDGSLPYSFYVIFTLQSQGDRTISMLFK